MYRLYIDEVGHHNMKSSEDPNERYLGLTGVIMELGYAETEFTNSLNRLKNTIFGRADFCLHRREILNREPDPFTILKQEEKRKEFDNLVLGLIEESKYRVFTVVIDKREHKQRYAVWQFQPYHYCMTIMLERYVLWLKRSNSVGDVLAESRGRKENKQLSKSHRRLYLHGTSHVANTIFQSSLTSIEIKLKRKTENISGLQIADLIANPACRDLICERTSVPMTARFGKKVAEILKQSKYLRNPNGGEVYGWGTKWLP